MNNNYVIEYLNENEFRKKERAIKKYNMLAYKKLLFDFYPSLRDGKFLGVLVSNNEKENISKYELKLPTDPMFAKVHDDIKLHYSLMSWRFSSDEAEQSLSNALRTAFIFTLGTALPFLST